MYTTAFHLKMKKSGFRTVTKLSESPYFTFICPIFALKAKKNVFCHGRQKTFFRWGKVDSNHRSQWQQIYSLPPLAAREFPLELVIGVEPTTCWLQISCSAIEPHQHSPISPVITGHSIIVSRRNTFVNPFFRVFQKPFFACKLPLNAV